jgi:hypothetical protein
MAVEAVVVVVTVVVRTEEELFVDGFEGVQHACEPVLNGIDLTESAPPNDFQQIEMTQIDCNHNRPQDRGQGTGDSWQYTNITTQTVRRGHGRGVGDCTHRSDC